jgi:hypothetical protein
MSQVSALGLAIIPRHPKQGGAKNKDVLTKANGACSFLETFFKQLGFLGNCDPSIRPIGFVFEDENVPEGC